MAQESVEQKASAEAEAKAKAKAEMERKAKAEAEAKEKAEARAGRISLLREGLILLEEIVNAVVTTREQHHPLNENRKRFMDDMKPALLVLGREDSAEKGVTPATDAEIADALRVASNCLGTAVGSAYKAWDARIKSWQRGLKAS